MTKKLFWSALRKFTAGFVLVGGLLFLPAGTLAYPAAWRFLALLFFPMLCLGAWLMVKSPALLAKRLESRESQGEQALVVKLSGLMFVVGFAGAGLEFRLGWARLPGWLSWGASAVFLLAYGLYARVMAENAYLSRTVRVQEGQRVIDTGLYAIVRHPMYSAVILLFLSIPLVLGSVVALAVFLPFPALMVRRIRNEEAVLAEGLEGYRDYQRRVKFRLIPFVW